MAQWAKADRRAPANYSEAAVGAEGGRGNEDWGRLGKGGRYVGGRKS